MPHSQSRFAAWVFEAEAQDYSATMTGNPFLFRESRILIVHLKREASLNAARQSIVEANSFEYRSLKSIPKRVNALARRFTGVPSKVLSFIASAPIAGARLVLLLVLAVRDRLFREFLQEVIIPMMTTQDAKLSRSATDRFFDSKAAMSPRVASWGSEARKKLLSVYLAAASEAGIVRQGTEMLAQRPLLDPATRELIETWFPRSYCALIGKD